MEAPKGNQYFMALFMAYTLILLLGNHIGALRRSLHRYFVISSFSLGSQLVIAKKLN